MSSFFEKARERAQQAAAQFGQHGQGASVAAGDDDGQAAGGSRKTSFTYTGSLPHMLRHGVAAFDPRYEYNRSFHLLSGKIKGVGIDHDALARETRGMATATYRWGQEQLAEKREDGVSDEALADVTDRLAYMVSLVGDLHADHAKQVEASRTDFKRIQKLESELAPKRQARVKIHRELLTLLPERAKVSSEKIDTLEAQLHQLEAADKSAEDELSKLKREALRSSYDSHFDSIIELGEKMALVARHGKLLVSQLPVYSPPFPAPRSHNRKAAEAKWEGEAQVAAIRAAVGPALSDFKPNVCMPALPPVASTEQLHSSDTQGYADSHKAEVASVVEQDPTSHATHGRSPSGSFAGPAAALTPPIEGGNDEGGLSARINMDPAIIPEHGRRRSSAVSPPTLPPRPAHDGQSAAESPFTNEATLAADDDSGPTFAETGSPIASGGDPGPLTGTLTARPKGPPAEKMPMPPPPPGAMSPPPAASALPSMSAPSPIAMPAAHAAVPNTASPPARLRRDGTIVRRGDADWQQAELEQLPPYQE